MSAIAAVGITRRYTGFNALDNVNFSVAAGERRALIGPNGAGKSTLFDILGGQQRPSMGQVMFGGSDITSRLPHERALDGLARTFQRNNLCAGLSVLENVRLAVQAHSKAKRDMFRLFTSHSELSDRAAAVLERLALIGLATRRAAELSYGDQRKLEIAMAMAGEPKVLMVDEPTAGMSRAETAQMVEVMRQLPREMSLLIVEHDMDVVAALADNATVLQNGVVIAQGKWSELQHNDDVQRAYLGSRKAK